MDDTTPLDDLPPSSKFVYRMLEIEGALTQVELLEETMLPRPTAQIAIDRLVDADLVDSRWNDTDARERIYELEVDDVE